MNDRRSAGARASIIAGAVALVLSVAAQAQDLTFDIGAGDLKAALEAYAKQTGQQLVYQPADVKGRTSPGVHGSMAPDKALEALLAGTGLKVNKDSSGAIAIFPAEAAAGGASTQTAGGEQKLEEVIVTATPISHLYVSSRTVTRLDTDPMLLPQSITNISGDLLFQQQVTSLAEALTNVSSTQVTSTNQIVMRGFVAAVARNGTVAADTNTRTDTGRPLVATERIEVLKGPAQIMQGWAAGFGGTANVITKVPEAEDVRYLGTAFGSDGYWRVDGDLNGTLLERDDSRLLGRVIGSTGGSGTSDVGIVGKDLNFISTGLRWVGDGTGTDVSLVYEYNRNRMPYPAYVIALNDRKVWNSGLKEWNFGGKDQYNEYDENTFDFRAAQKLSENWSVSLNYIYADKSVEFINIFPSYVPAQGVVRAFQSDQRKNPIASTAGYLKADLRGKVNLGPVENNLVLAFDYNDLSQHTPGGPNRAPRTNILYVTNLSTGVKTETDLGDSIAPDVHYDSSETGLLLSDQINWGRWHGLLGVRYVSFETKDKFTFWYDPEFSETDATRQSEHQTLPQYGIVYSWTDDLSLYASASSAFSPNFGARDYKGDLLPNTTGTQYEVGVKTLMLDQQLAVTLAGYRINQRDVAAIDPDPPEEPPPGQFEVYYTIPGRTTKGFEFEVSGQPVRGLDLRMNYTYQEVEAVRNTKPIEGYVPNSLSLWGQYWLSRNAGQGWWAGAGLTANDATTTRSGYSTAGSTVVDLSAGYQAEHWSAILGVRNVFDIQTYSAVGARPPFQNPLPGATWQLDLNYRF